MTANAHDPQANLKWVSGSKVIFQGEWGYISDTHTHSRPWSMRGEAAAQRASALARRTLLIKPPALIPPLMPKKE